jgi:signal transduction histidine kinase
MMVAMALPSLKRPDPFDTLKIAAYISWVAVFLEVWRDSAMLAPVAGISARAIASGLMLLFLVGFLVVDRTKTGGLVIQVLSTFALLMLGPTDTSPALLVISAVVIAVRFSTRSTILLLAAINVLFISVIATRWHRVNPLLLTTVYAGFQFFAAFAAHAVRRADETSAELRQVNAHLLATRMLLAESARDGERLRLSRELHDVSGHKLTALKLNLAVLGRDTALVERRELQTARSLVDELLHDIRGVVAQLRNHDGIDLREAITRLAEPLHIAHVHVHVDEDARVNDAERAAALIRLAQEGLTNAAKHASPQNVWLNLTREADLLQLVVEDYGRVEKPVQPGHGLTGMRERVVALGGELEIGVAQAGGMRICARLPRGHAA